MIQPLTFSHTKSGLDSAALKPFFETLKPYIQHLAQVSTTLSYEKHESSLVLPKDERVLKEVLAIAKKYKSTSLKYIFLIGIGGSSLGTKAIYDALLGYKDKLDAGRHPKIFFIDTTNARYLENLNTFIKKRIESLEEVVVNIVSKSGTTTESIANAEFILSLLEKRFGKSIYKQVCVTTDKGSPLWDASEKKRLSLLAIPKRVGGRFSVFSTVGLFPLTLAGIDGEKLLQGAIAANEQCTDNDTEKNIAAISAAVLMHHLRQGKSIHDTFIFHPELISLGAWYRQLMAESIGKEKDITGKVVHTGMTPQVSIGSKDLHSVAQLNLGGPLDKVTTFLKAGLKSNRVMIPKSRVFPNIVPAVTGKSMTEIMDAIYKGTTLAYAKHELPFMEIALPDISAYSLGGFMQCKMIEIMYLAMLMEVDAFDQPHVESYKIETKRILMED